MPTAVVDGIETHFEVIGDGPPLLMFSPGGFNGVAGNWWNIGVYKRIRPVDQLAQHYTCIVFDRREAGESGGRIERLQWSNYVAQGIGLLDHLDIERAHVMGGCVGCSSAAAIAIEHPARIASMVLYSPAGGALYRISSQGRFTDHLAFVRDHGLAGVVERATASSESFSKEPKLGPWVSVIRRNPEFAASYASFDQATYEQIIVGIGRTMFDRDTVPGVEPEDLLVTSVPALIVPGQDPSHATSAARYLEECIPLAEYWDVPVAEQTDANAPQRILEFLDTVPV